MNQPLTKKDLENLSAKDIANIKSAVELLDKWDRENPIGVNVLKKKAFPALYSEDLVNLQAKPNCGGTIHDYKKINDAEINCKRCGDIKCGNYTDFEEGAE